MADKRRLVALGVPTQQAEELAKQIDEGGGAGQALTVAERAEGKADTALVDVAEAQTTADNALTAATPVGGYAAALAQASIPFLFRISATISGRLVEWVRQTGGPCLGGGWVPAGDATPQHFGGFATGLVDVSGPIKSALEFGGNIFFPAGVYLFVGAGPNTGGAYCSINKSVNVICDPEASFVASFLDNDMIRMSIVAGGAGLPIGGIDVTWRGGFFDQRNQMVSQVVPNRTEFPPPAGKNGGSNTTDALSIRGEYVSSGQTLIGIRSAIVTDVSSYAGDHWADAGGDSCIFVGGCANIEIHSNQFLGNRDLGVYASGTGANGTCRAVIYNNRSVNCFHGFGVKRNLSYSSMFSNYVENCVRGFISDQVDGRKSDYVEVSGNTGRKCNEFIRLTDGIGSVIDGNNFTELGATMPNGTDIVPVIGSTGISLRGGSWQRVVDNKIIGATPGLDAAYPTQRGLIGVSTGDITGGVSDAVFSRNVGDGLRSVGGGGDGLRNSYIENFVANATSSPNVTSLGTSGYEVRIDVATKEISYRNRVLFSDGSASSPSLARASGSTAGIFFGTNQVAISANSLMKFVAGGDGVGFNGSPPLSTPLWGNPSGSRIRSTFDTTTVTTAELAQRFAALLDDLNSYGLHRR